MVEPVYEVVNGYLRIEDKELEISFVDTVPLGPALGASAPEHEKKEQIVHKKLIQEALYLSSKLDGELRRYYRDGAVSSSSFYRGGKLHGPSICFYTDGSMASRAYFIDDRREGRANFFAKDGSLACQLCFKNGLFHGTQRFYFAGGNLKCQLPYIEGFFDGQLQLFFANGFIEREIAMSRGKRSGIDCYWDDSGVILFAFEYDNGKLVKTQIKDPIAMAYKL